MPELNKFLDLEGLKVFWDQINEKKQNRTIWYNGKEMLLEDCLNEIKKEIENVQNEIGNIEELDSINQHIKEIKTTLQEIDSEIDNLNENYVPESRTIAGLDLINDITTNELQDKLNLIQKSNIVSINTNSNTNNQVVGAKLFFDSMDMNAIAHQSLSQNILQNKNILNGNIKQENLSSEFYDAGVISPSYAIWPGNSQYQISGSYEILGQTCTLNIGIKIKSGYGEMWYPLPIMPYSATNQYSLIYTHDSKNVLYLVSVGDQKPNDAPTEYPHLLHVKRVDGKTISQDDELHLIFSYRIR